MGWGGREPSPLGIRGARLVPHEDPITTAATPVPGGDRFNLASARRRLPLLLLRGY
jgi:hypothetical protein